MVAIGVVGFFQNAVATQTCDREVTLLPTVQTAQYRVVTIHCPFASDYRATLERELTSAPAEYTFVESSSEDGPDVFTFVRRD